MLITEDKVADIESLVMNTELFLLHPSIFYHPFLLCCTQGAIACSLPRYLRVKLGFTPDKSPAHHRAHTETSIHTHIHTHKQVRVANYSGLHVPELWEETGEHNASASHGTTVC